MAVFNPGFFQPTVLPQQLGASSHMPRHRGASGTTTNIIASSN